MKHQSDGCPGARVLFNRCPLQGSDMTTLMIGLDLVLFSLLPRLDGLDGALLAHLFVYILFKLGRTLSRIDYQWSCSCVIPSGCPDHFH